MVNQKATLTVPNDMRTSLWPNAGNSLNAVLLYQILPKFGALGYLQNIAELLPLLGDLLLLACATNLSLMTIESSVISEVSSSAATH